MKLQEIGLSQYESRVYEALVKIGKATASQIAAEAEVSYGRIYEVLSSLERKGLVKVIPEKTKKYTSSDPKNLMKLVDAKKEELDKIKEDVKKLEKIYMSREEEPVVVGRGRKAFYKLEAEMPKPKKSWYRIKYTTEYRPEWERKAKECIKKGAILKDLVRYDKETEKNVKKSLQIHKNIRKIKNNGIAISIIDDKAIMISLIKSNVTMLIKDKAFIELMKDLFQKAYKLSEKIAA